MRKILLSAVLFIAAAGVFAQNVRTTETQNLRENAQVVQKEIMAINAVELQMNAGELRAAMNELRTGSEVFTQPAAPALRNGPGVILFEGFEGIGNTAIPAGWQRAGSTTTAITNAANGIWVSTTVNPRSGLRTGLINLNGNAAGTQANWGALRSPYFSLVAGTTYEIEFWFHWSALTGTTHLDALIVDLMQGVRGGTEAETEVIVEIADIGPFAGQTPMPQGAWTRVAVVFTAVESGDDFYLEFLAANARAFGFTSANRGGAIRLDDVRVRELSENELAISANFPYTQFPECQTINPIVRVTNTGTAAQTNVTLSVELNGNNVGTSAPIASLAPGASANLTVPGFNVVLGNNDLTLSVSSAEGADDDVAFTFIGTDEMFARDLLTAPMEGGGVGFPTGGQFAMVFEVTQTTNLGGVQLLFATGGTNLAYTVSVYPMTGPLATAATPLVSQTLNRVPGEVNFDFEYLLTPGYYAVVIASGGSVGISFDENPAGGWYIRTAATGALTFQPGGQGFGSLGMRLIVCRELLDIDAAITAITSPVSGISLSNAETVTATIRNNGTTPITTAGMVLEVNGATIATETFTGNIAPGASQDFTFAATVDLSAAGSFEISVTVNVAGDENPANDTYTITVVNTICTPASIPWFEGFEGTTGDNLPPCWTGSGWITTATGPNNIPGVTSATGVPAHTGTRFMAVGWQSGNVWAFSNALALTAGNTYTICFYYMAPGWAEFAETDDFVVRIGQTPTPAGMADATIVYSHINTVTVDWTFATMEFTPAVSGDFYLAFHYISPAGEGFYVAIDDVSVNVDLAVVNLTPANNATDVAINADVIVTFNQPVVINDLSGITFTPAVTGISATVNGAVLTITHDGFAENTLYSLTIASGAILPATDTGCPTQGGLEAITWSFTSGDTSVGLPDVLTGIQIFPNPVGSEMQIQSELPITRIVVLDMQGRVVLQQQGGNTVNMQQVAPGIYTVQIHTEAGVVPIRIVKK